MLGLLGEAEYLFIVIASMSTLARSGSNINHLLERVKWFQVLLCNTNYSILAHRKGISSIAI